MLIFLTFVLGQSLSSILLVSYALQVAHLFAIILILFQRSLEKPWILSGFLAVVVVAVRVPVIPQ